MCGRCGQRSHALASYWFNTVLITRLLDSFVSGAIIPQIRRWALGTSLRYFLYLVNFQGVGAVRHQPHSGAFLHGSGDMFRLCGDWSQGKGPQQLNDLLKECLVGPASEAMQSQTFLCKKSL